MKYAILITSVFGMSFVSTSAFAYIGPGMGTGVVASVLGIVAGFAMLLIGVVWYPLKRLMRRITKKKK